MAEAKSAKIEETAKRGGDNLFQEFVKDVIAYSAVQISKFITYFTEHPGMKTLTDLTGNRHLIDSRLFETILPITITLDTAYIQWDWQRLREAGVLAENIVEPLVLSLADLETIFEIIPLEAEKLHYLKTRIRFQKQFTFVGDELDLLGAYLGGHLPVRPEQFTNAFIDFSNCSAQLDFYFATRPFDPTTEKPSVRRSPLWNELLQQLDTKRPTGWLEASFLLLAIGYESQTDFEKQLDAESAKLLASQNSEDSWHSPLDITTPDGSFGVWFALYKGLDFSQDLLPKLNLPLLPAPMVGVIALDVTGEKEPIQTYLKRFPTGTASAPKPS